MIGNDIVDLAKATKESNIFRPRYLEKICSPLEIDLVFSSSNPVKTFWRIWTMKECAYKAFQRKYKFGTTFNPFAFSCHFDDLQFGRVVYGCETVSTQTLQNKQYVYSEVLNSAENFRFFGSTSSFLECLKNQFELNQTPEFQKTNEGIPVINIASKILKISKTHHGNFQVFQY